MVTIWDEVFFKIRFSFYGLVIRKNFLSESSHRIYAHVDVVVEVIDAQSSFDFEFFLDEEFIEFW